MDTVADKIKKRSKYVVGLVSLTTPLTDVELDKLSEEINQNDWRKLGYRLGIGEPALARAERENQYNLAEGIYRSLARWRKGQVESEERSVLLEALISCGLRRLEDRLCRGFPARIGSVMSASGPFCSLDVDQCRRELMNNYRTSLCMIQLVPWDPKSHVDMSSVFTNVRLVREDTSSATKQKVLLPGSYNDILKLTVNNAKPLRILIEGKAGSGKTTLMAKFAYDWMEEKDSPLRNVSLLFCLQLRYINQDNDFGDAVVKLLLPEDTSITAHQIEEFARKNSDQVLIIVDGYDEFHPDIHGIKGIGNILRILENKRLTGCQVMVTCRPWKAADFKDQHLAKHYTHMSLEGFSTSSTETFIKRYFQDDPSLANHLLSFLNDNPAVQTVTPFPLFCAMLCQVWKDADANDRDKMKDIVTLSRLFDHIFRYLWGHFDKKQRTCSKKEKVQGKRLTLTRRRGSSASSHKKIDMVDCLKQLGRVALMEGLVSPEKKLQFTREDFKKCPDVLRLATSLGLLIRQKSRSSGDRTVPYSETNEGIIFFHKLAQEKCAGIYLSSMCTRQPKKFVRTLKELYILTRADEFRYVLQFACGEDLYTSKKILRHMSNITPYQKLALECNFESQCGSKSNKRMSKFFENPRLFLTGRPTAYSFNALEYYLKNSEVLRPVDTPVEFKYFATDGLGPPQLAKLVTLLNQPHFDFMIQFNMEYSRITGPDVKAFIESLSNKKYLGILEMASSSSNEQFVESLLCIPNNGFDAMLMMYLPILDAKWARDLLMKLPAICPRLAALETTFNVTDNEGSSDVFDDVDGKDDDRPHEDEVNCNLDIVPFSELMTLVIKGCKLPRSGSMQLANTLSHAAVLEKLHLTEPSLHPTFYSNLTPLNNLTELSVKEYTFGEFHLDEFLDKCPIVEDLCVAAVENHSSGVDGILRSLTSSMAKTSLLRSVTLWFPGTEHSYGGHIDGEIFKDFCESILKCVHLSKLLLWHVPLGEEAAIHLLETCLQHRSLSIIRLSRCYTMPCQALDEMYGELQSAGRRIYMAHGY